MKSFLLKLSIILNALLIYYGCRYGNLKENALDWYAASKDWVQSVWHPQAAENPES